MLQLNGYYQYPGRAAREAARLTLGERHLTLEQGGQQQIQLLSAVKVSAALGTIPPDADLCRRRPLCAAG
ncbi:hypothetical protein JNO12_23025 [Erwinia aphidicola]|nr:hypothetical protein [Erwinia aphidicola]